MPIDNELLSPDAAPLQLSSMSALLADLENNLSSLPELFIQLQPALEKGITLGELKGVKDEELEQLYKIAYDLCQQEDWRDALSVLLNLIAHNPLDTRFHFAAGMCFQQLQEPVPAAMSYAQALMLNPEDAASAFRLGEALTAAQQFAQAIEVFTAALELINADYDRYHHLYEFTEARLQELRVTSHQE